MDTQKILWIVFSVTLFLLAVVVVGFIWFLPPDDATTEDAIANAGVVAETRDGFDPIEWARETEDVPGIEDSVDTEDGGSSLLVIGEAEDQMESDSEARPQTEIVVTEESGSSEQVRTTTQVQPQQQTPQAPAQTTPTRTTTTVARATETPTRTQAPQPAQPQPRNVTITQYWIQAGSFASRSRAEDTQKALRDKGITARLTSIDMSGSTYFRVRIGPYDAKAEAEKFLDWIKEIDSFGSSYISEVYTTRTVN